MTNLRAANRVVEYLSGFCIVADVAPIEIRHHDLVATIGYEVVVVLPICKNEVSDAGVRAADQDDQRSEPPV